MKSSTSRPKRLMRFLVGVRKAALLFFYSIKILTFRDWLKFWFTFQESLVVTIAGLKIEPRTNTMGAKATDLYMAVSCLVWEQYRKEGFEIGDGDVVIDVGGHIGSFALYASKTNTTGKIIVFEPDIKNYKQLEKNIGLNKLQNISLNNFGLAMTEGVRTLYRDKHNSAANSLYGSGAGDKVQVETLGEVFKKNNLSHCDLMKLDCEGAELEILKGAPVEILRLVRRVVLEYHDKAEVSQIVDLLKKAEFSDIKIVTEDASQGMIWARKL